MCTVDGVTGELVPGGGGFGSVAEALRAGGAFADYLNSPAAGDLDGPACGEVLAALGRIQSRLATSRTGTWRSAPRSAARG